MVLGISGTPKKGGFTDNLIDKAIEGAASTGAAVEKIVLNDLNIKPCQECGDYTETGGCRIEDDMEGIYTKFDSADHFIIASPIYFGSISAQLKTMIDRFQTVWVRKYVLKIDPPYRKRRKGVFLCAGGKDVKEYFENAKEIIKIFFTTLDIDYTGELFFGGTNIKDDDRKEKEKSLKKAFDLGVELAR